MTCTQDKIRGSLLGGAAGDALGYPVEFMSLREIQSRYGAAGITAYALDRKTNTAIVSDDTQMTMFTAAGILAGETARIGAERPVFVEGAVREAYFDWLDTQEPGVDAKRGTWLSGIPALYALRAPGNTCLSALRSRKRGTTEQPINGSKGCGGIMRVAPVGLYYNRDGKNIEAVDRLAAEAAAITHGHPLGWLSAAAFAHIVNRAVYGGCAFGDTLHGFVHESEDTLRRLWPGVPELQEMTAGMEAALSLADSARTDVENIAALGEGWVAEEALYIALYCAARYKSDFSGALTAAVNHKGDSDSTGAITGNIVGALLGYEAIPARWKEGLELREELLRLADDLSAAWPMTADFVGRTPGWRERYGGK